MNILVVDDIKDNLYLMESLLNGSGYNVTTSINGKEALEMLAKEKFEMIIADILMPIMDGFKLCRTVKENKDWVDIPFIFYTATYTEKKDEEFALKLGASKFIIKPQEPQTLLNIIKETFIERSDSKSKLISDPLESNSDVYKLYSERLVNKIEKKMLDLEKEKKERKIIEEEIETLAHAIKCISDSVIMTDEKNKILFVNQAFVNNYGYSKEESLGQIIDLLYSPNNNKDISSILSEALKGSWQGEILQRKKNGLEFPAYLSSSVMKRNGEQTSLIWIFSDITRQKQLEEQVLQAQKMEAIGTLAGGIAHDFNNMLGVIMGYTDLTLSNLTNMDLVKTNLQHVMDASKRAKDMVQQILAFSRKSEQSMESVNIGNIINETINFLRGSLPSTIKINHNIDNGLGMIFGNATQINQVLMNLCTNAKHAMREDGGILEIKLKETVIDENNATIIDLEHGIYQQLTVHDTGSGIGKDIIDRIFEPYFTTKKDGEGTGMGLSVIYGIIKSHNGHINVFSQLGKGTIFNVYFPVLETVKKIELKTDKHLDLMGNNERILFVDDEISLAKLGNQMLKELGYQVESSTSSIETLKAFEDNPDKFDLIVTDMTMPHMTGIKLAEEIHKIKPDIPVILCTGFSNFINKNNFMKMGISELIMKPVSIKELAIAIKGILGKKK